MVEFIHRLGSFRFDIEDSPDNICVFLKGTKPNYHKSMFEAFHQNICWGSRACQMRFKKELIDVPLDNTNPVTARHILNILRTQLSQLPVQKGILHELHELFSNGIYRQDDCATKLLTSVPTLKRQLKLAKTQFSQELRVFRIETACHRLKYSGDTIARLADRLGFQDVGSFRRLFKKYTGLSPSAYKAGFLGD